MFGEKKFGFFAREPKPATTGSKERDNGGSGRADTGDETDDAAFAMTVDLNNPLPVEWDPEWVQYAKELVRQIGWETSQYGPPDHIEKAIAEYFVQNPADETVELPGIDPATRADLIERGRNYSIMNIHRSVVELKNGRQPKYHVPSTLIPVLEFVAEHLR